MITIALGANLPSRFGSPADTLCAALRAMEARSIRVLARSSVWLSAPVPVSDQPWYHNAVVSVEASLSALGLLKALKAIEADFGRVSDVRNAARVLDLDIVSYHDDVIEAGALSVPHPRMAERAFVLLPLQEIAPDWVHPVSGKALADLVSVLPAQAIERARDLVLEVA